MDGEEKDTKRRGRKKLKSIEKFLRTRKLEGRGC